MTLQPSAVPDPAHTHLHLHEVLADVYIADLRSFRDERGVFTETFRREWFPQVSWERIQTNWSVSKAGVLRGLHYHFRQIDYWLVVQGTNRAGLADLRPNSPSYLQSATLELSADQPRGLFIPVGVAHGFYALTDAMLTYTVNNYYDGADELGVAWNDPDLAVPWEVTAPVLSPRDAGNPPLRAVPPERLPSG
jgi:dTDP-4-dehydrorhamnose 3,5-epimerase